MLLFYRRLRPGLASQRVKSLCFLIHGLDHDERKRGTFRLFYLCFLHFIPSSTLICIPMLSFAFVGCCLFWFLISRGCIGYLWAFFPPPLVLLGLFCFSLVEDGCGEERRESVQCTIISTFLSRGVFVSRDSYSFFNDGIEEV
jgi:hypothetical protein